MAIVDHLKNAAGEVWDAIKDGADWVQDKIKKHKIKACIMAAVPVIFLHGWLLKQNRRDAIQSKQTVELQQVKLEKKKLELKNKELENKIQKYEEALRHVLKKNKELNKEKAEVTQQQPQSENPFAAKPLNTKKTVEEAEKRAALQRYLNQR